MANSFLDRIPALREHSIFVDPFGGDSATRANIRGIRQSIEWVRNGGMLVIFPAGEVSHVTFGEPRVVDPAWSSTVARIIRKTGAPALPVYFDGRNSALFQIAGLIHPRLRTVMLPRELLRRRGKILPMRIGSPIAFSRLREIADDEAMTAYLRERTYFLAHRVAGVANRAPLPRAAARHEKIVPAGSVDRLREEVERLPAERILVTHGDYVVAYSPADAIPLVLREIGRLRELAFRAAGEGTGFAIDLDRFDHHYDHLFLWNRASAEIIGAYRIGRADAIAAKAGLDGLYTATLFRYGRELLPSLGGALELGRSFVAPAHQRNFNALLLLWKGIGGYVLRHPGYRTLFGPVSISRDFSTTSRELIATFLRRHLTDPSLARHVRPRVPFACRGTFNGGPLLPGSIGTLDELGSLVEEMEGGDRGIPVLLRHYLKLGGKLLGLNVDREFHDVLDALIAVDLTRTDPALLARYMGREGAEEFLLCTAMPAGIPVARP
jgi:putative hemolysin